MDEFMEKLVDWSGVNLSAPVENPNTAFSFELGNAYPNPFNSQIVAPFSLKHAGSVSLSMFDVNGRNVSEIINGEYKAGNHQISINAGNLGISSGVYYLKLTSGENIASQKILYIR